jgi:hypothetical protein
MMRASSDILARQRDPGDTRHSLTDVSRTRNTSRIANACHGNGALGELLWLPELPGTRGIERAFAGII